jgi:antibiotic biosynthesis monooxygenase (ABM) superfamily enzyme
MAERTLRLVSLWIRPGEEAAFAVFEEAAGQIMARHGGEIERAFRIGPEAGEDAPFEVHIVSFPDDAAYAAYRSDPEILALRDRRNRIIAQTRVLSAEEVGSYSLRVRPSGPKG